MAVKKTETFEEAMKKLEELVKKLEDGNVPLEESIKAYEEGIALCSRCESRIEDFRKRIVKINPVDNSEVSIAEEENEL